MRREAGQAHAPREQLCHCMVVNVQEINGFAAQYEDEGVAELPDLE
jgi:hypothetical protein